MVESLSWSDWNEKGRAHFKKQEWWRSFVIRP